MPEVEQRKYGLRRRLSLGFDEAVAAVRNALQQQGFGVLTEIDVKATLKAKLDVDRDPYLILGACNPPLANQAINADPEVGMLLPCNVVVRVDGDAVLVDGDAVLVEAMDREAAMGLVENPDVATVASQARDKLRAALATLPG